MKKENKITSKITAIEDYFVMIKVLEEEKSKIKKDYNKKIREIDINIASINNKIFNLSHNSKANDSGYNSFSSILPEDWSKKIEVVFRNGRKSIMLASLVDSYCDNHICENNPNSPDLWRYV